ncbi:uncharacterized protein A4U43_C05F25930 [Asparagus officinalis]|uniref:Protein FAM33A n=1 Tax=Asparagus officinalis TaxID=4686 RepID=A0A5P1EZ06_ASPOF|nr:uncharacterized protein LOC109840540 [Asparagus officinalis]ONK69711.1 uncharacterized protein A4U43_C05F25930 [Asparagus officinalis]
MDDRRRRQKQQQHSAVDEVMNLMIKANRDLSIVQRRLDQEFQATYPEHANPCKLVARIKKIQEDLVSLKELCRDLLKEKQDLIDKATTLVAQRNSLQRLLASSGLPLIDDSDEMAYTHLNQVINEWADHVRGKKGDEKESEEDINQILFSAIVRNN